MAFFTRQKALYYFHYSAGVPANSMVCYKMNGLNFTIGIIKTDTGYPEDQVTTDNMQWIDANTSLSVSTSYVMFNQGPLSQSAWLWFRIDTAMQPIVAFRVALSKQLSAPPLGSVLKFDTVLLNEGQGWNRTISQFIAPVAGYYFASLGVAALGGYKSCMYLAVNTQTPLCTCLQEMNSRNNIETVRNALMVYLNQGDVMYGQVYDNVTSYYYSDNTFPVFLQAFLYSPANYLPPVAWSVSRSSTSPFSGPIDYMMYDIINVNVGGVWNQTNNYASINVAGVYFLDLGSYLGGCTSQYSTNCSELVQLLLNGSPIIEVKLNTSTMDNNDLARSRSILIQLSIGDAMRVRMPTGKNSRYINGKVVNEFTGFLINPI